MKEELKKLVEKQSTFEAQIASLMAQRGLLSRKNIDKPKKAEIDAKVDAIKSLNIKPLAIEIAKIKMADPKRQEFFNYCNSLKNSNLWKYISINGYKNDYNEIANHNININYKFSQINEKDIEIINSITTADLRELVDSLSEKYAFLTINDFEKALYRMKNPSKVKSDAQKDAYTYIGKGIKVHNESGRIFLSGIFRQKSIIQDGIYEEGKKSRPETIARRLIEKKFGLMKPKIKIYNFDFIKSFNFQDNTLVITPEYVEY